MVHLCVQHDRRIVGQLSLLCRMFCCRGSWRRPDCGGTRPLPLTELNVQFHDRAGIEGEVLPVDLNLVGGEADTLVARETNHIGRGVDFDGLDRGRRRQVYRDAVVDRGWQRQSRRPPTSAGTGGRIIERDRVLVRDDVEGVLANDDEEEENPLMPLWLSIALYVLIICCID